MQFIISFLLAIISSMVIDNVILSRFYGICSFVGVGNKVKSSISMGIAVSFVIILAAIVCWPIFYFILTPAKLTFMDTIVYILVIASLVQVVGIFLKKKAPAVYKSLGIYLPLITTNCAVLGVVQTNTAAPLDLSMATAAQMWADYGLCILNGVGTSLGFLAVIVLFSCIRERMDCYNIPKAFKGIPIALVVAAIMAMAITGLSGFGGGQFGL